MTASLTVLMPVYNAQPYLAEAIESILSQSFRDFVFLIVDNGSTDSSGEILRSFKDSRIRIVSLGQNVGPPPALNMGLRETKTRYVARMDADDVSLPGRLEAQMQFLEAHLDYSLVGTQYKKIDEKGCRFYTPRFPVSEEDIKWKLMFNSPFIHSSVMMRREVLQNMGGYEEKWRYASDFDLWARMVRQGCKVANLSKTYLLNRKHEGQDGARAGNPKLIEEASMICLENVRHFTGLDVSRYQMIPLLTLLSWDAQCFPDPVEGVLEFLEKVAKKYKERTPTWNPRFYIRTLWRLGFLRHKLGWSARLKSILRGNQWLLHR